MKGSQSLTGSRLFGWGGLPFGGSFCFQRTMLFGRFEGEGDLVGWRVWERPLLDIEGADFGRLINKYLE